MAKYVVALYLRLSVEDTKVESMSIKKPDQGETPAIVIWI